MNEKQKHWCSSILSRLGHSLQKYELLKAEASHRIFYRLHTKTSSFIFMISPPSLENNAQFVNLSQVFTQHGIPVPQVLEYAQETGHVLMTDVGSKHFKDIYNTGTEPLAINRAIDTLIDIQNVTHDGIPQYTAQRLEDEISIFDEWVVRKLLNTAGIGTSDTKSRKILVEQTQEQEQVCVHRDYHCRNLLFSDNSLGIVDFQDALIGPAFYDLASLLFDCYHDFREEDVDHYLTFYLNASSRHKNVKIKSAKRWLELTAIQRQIKAMGIFVRLFLKDNKKTHLQYVPSVMKKSIQLMSRQAEMKSLKELFVSIENPLIQKIRTFL